MFTLFPWKRVTEHNIRRPLFIIDIQSSYQANNKNNAKNSNCHHFACVNMRPKPYAGTHCTREYLWHAK